MSKLMLKIAIDQSFMETGLENIVKVDSFTKNLLNVNRTILKEGVAQSNISCINRSDYMLHRFQECDRETTGIRQVEVNAISVAMSAHSQSAMDMHRYLATKYRLPTEHVKWAANDSLKLVAQGLIDAYDCYKKSDCFVLLVAEDRSFNFSEHLLIELEVHNMRPDIRVVRKPFRELPETIRLGPNKELLLDSDKEIALVYFRYGYDPSNYKFEGAWDTRLLLERSRAIKCPPINFHLSGVKKFQQVLSCEQELERFLDPKEAARVANVSCKFWSIESGSPTGEKGYQLGLNSPENLVLKPQREGGGHNIFGSDIKTVLSELAEFPAERSQYILMEYINSPREKNKLLLRDNLENDSKFQPEHIVSELGIFGSITYDGQDITSNRAAGYLVRSKRHGVKEGGVASGYAGISSLLLVEDALLDSDRQNYYH